LNIIIKNNRIDKDLLEKKLFQQYFEQNLKNKVKIEAVNRKDLLDTSEPTAQVNLVQFDGLCKRNMILDELHMDFDRERFKHLINND